MTDAGTGTQLQTLSIWITLRNAAEQRNNWFFIGAAGGLTAVLALWPRIYCIRPAGFWILVAIAVGFAGGVCVGAKAAWEDARKLNVLAKSMQSLPVVRDGRYEFAPIYMASATLLIGVVVVVILAFLAVDAGRVMHLDRAKDPLCGPADIPRDGSAQWQQQRKP